MYIYLYLHIYWILKPWTTWSPISQVDRMASHKKWENFQKLHSKTSGDGWKFYVHMEMDKNLRNTTIFYSMLFHIWWDGEHPQLLAKLMWKSMASHVRRLFRLRPDVSEIRDGQGGASGASMNWTGHSCSIHWIIRNSEPWKIIGWHGQNASLPGFGWNIMSHY